MEVAKTGPRGVDNLVPAISAVLADKCLGLWWSYLLHSRITCIRLRLTRHPRASPVGHDGTWRSCRAGELSLVTPQQLPFERVVAVIVPGILVYDPDLALPPPRRLFSQTLLTSTSRP
jgi:hypothetical protein